MKNTILALSLVLPAVAGAAQPLAYVPLDQPCRLLDTRADVAGPLVPGVVRPVSAADLCGIPFEAKAIEANLTATNTQGPGFLSLLRPVGRPGEAPAPKSSVLNFSAAGQTIANAALVTLGEPAQHWGGVFWLVAGVSGTDVVVDVSGYYVALP